MSFTPGAYDITIYRSRTYSQVFTWTDASNALVNLTGATASFVARSHFEAKTPFINLTTSNGGITLGGSAGTVTLTISATDSAKLPVCEGVYDLQVTDNSGTSTPLLRGAITILESAAR